MKFFIVIIVSLQFSSSLIASGLFEDYLVMKKEVYFYYEDKQSKKAYGVVNTFIKKHPKYIRAQNLLAVLNYWDGDLKSSKSILLSILEQKSFKQSLDLLKRIEKKEGKKSTTVKNQQELVPYDVKYLLDSIENNPDDIINREILAKYYLSVGENQKVKRLTNEILKIDPDRLNDESEQKKSIIFPSKEVDKIVAKLNYFYKYSRYNKYINLYNSLENNKVIMPTKMHIKALYSALELRDYKRAKSILYMYRMPKNKNIQKVEKLIEKKLALN